MFDKIRDQNKIEQMSAVCLRGLRHAQGDTIQSVATWVVQKALHSCSKVECMLRMVLCSRALRKYVEGGHDWASYKLANKCAKAVTLLYMASR